MTSQLRPPPTLPAAAEMPAQDRLRVGMFRARHVRSAGRSGQVWVVEGVCPMSDAAMSADPVHAPGGFASGGILKANAVLAEAGFRPAAQWHVSADPTVWVLDALANPT